MFEATNVKLKDDSFVHFTTKERANEILNGGKILQDPPYKKFGIDAVTAVSVNYGKYVPRVQMDHIPNNKDAVAIWFRTNTLPSYGYIEEVIWHEDVKLIDGKIISKEQAISLLENNEDIEDLYLLYENKTIGFKNYIKGRT